MSKLINTLNWADLLLIAIILISALISIKRGLAKEVLSLLSWVLAFTVAFLFSEKLASLLANWISTPSVRITVAMVSLFAMTLIVGAMINNLIADMLKKTGLTGTDRLFGVGFGLLRGFVIIMALLTVSKSSFFLDDWWRQSVFIPRFLALESWSLHTVDVVSDFFNKILAK